MSWSNKSCFALQNLVYAFLDGSSAGIFDNVRLHRLADAVAAVFGLALNGGVPPAVQVEHVGCLLQVQTQATSAQRQHQNLVLAAGLEPLNQVAPLFLRSVAGERERSEFAQMTGHCLHA